MSQATETAAPDAGYWNACAETAAVLSRHRGPANAISSAELARQVLGDADRASTVRNYIDDVIRQFNLPVGNNGDGYFVIESVAEFRRLMGQYESRRRSATERMRALGAAFYGDREVWV